MRLAWAVAALAAGTSAAGPAAASSAPRPLRQPEGMELVWADEFDGDTIDPSNWTFDIGGGGWGNGEAQYYTDRSENARLEDGRLVIELRQERFEDSYYTSARLTTLGLREFQYGRIEATRCACRAARERGRRSGRSGPTSTPAAATRAGSGRTSARSTSWSTSAASPT